MTKNEAPFAPEMIQTAVQRWSGHSIDVFVILYIWSLAKHLLAGYEVWFLKG